MECNIGMCEMLCAYDWVQLMNYMLTEFCDRISWWMTKNSATLALPLKWKSLTHHVSVLTDSCNG